MPLDLWQASYSPEGTKGSVKEGGTKRRQYIAQLVEKAGGKLHANVSRVGRARCSGDRRVPRPFNHLEHERCGEWGRGRPASFHPLLTPEEVDAATKKTVAYRPPGA